MGFCVGVGGSDQLPIPKTSFQYVCFMFLERKRREKLYGGRGKQYFPLVMGINKKTRTKKFILFGNHRCFPKTRWFVDGGVVFDKKKSPQK